VADVKVQVGLHRSLFLRALESRVFPSFRVLVEVETPSKM
jgi:hypothetical protein